MKVIFSESEREEEKVRKRMDRFDAVIHEYLRSNRKTVEELAMRVGCDPSSLWRYDIVAGCLRLANVSNENLRYILGL